MPQWQIAPDEYLKRLHLNRDEFRQRLRLPRVDEIAKIVPLRDIKRIESLIPIDRNLLLHLLRQINTLDGRPVFSKASLSLVKIDPRQLKIGQKYVYRENYQRLMEDASDIFHTFAASAGGLCDMGAYFVFGRNGNDDYAMACYLPPIVETHGRDLVIMDGIHRNYIAKQTGAAFTVILVEPSDLPFPCSVRNWDEISVISLADKPKDLGDRYFDLQKDLFRDLKYLGIDG